MDRRLQKLKRDELLQILLELEQENEQLVEENRQLKEQLAQRELVVAEAGSIAEAALKLSGVFEAAQEAADRYLTSVMLMCDGVSAGPTDEAQVEAGDYP